MTLKTKMSLLVFLTSLSIVSIGFSSWSITAETTAEINGNIEVDNVVDVKDCVYISSINELKYCEYGFMNDSNQIVDEGKLTLGYYVDLNQCEAYFSPLSSLEITLSLTLSDNDSDCEILSMLSGYDVSSDGGFTPLHNPSGDFTDIYICFEEIIPNNTEHFNFYVDYYFYHEINSYFKKNVYDYFINSELEFVIETTITAK